MVQLLRSRLGATNPDDLFQVASDFLEVTAASNPFGSSYSTLTSTILSASDLSTRWSRLLSSVPASFQGALLRCVNAGLRSFHPNVKQQLYANSFIGIALEQAKTDKSDIGLIPMLNSPLLWHSFYSSIADNFGGKEVQSAVACGQLLLVAIRNSTSTLVNKGRGSYDDAIIVVKGYGSARKAVYFPACTEPTAQYSKRAEIDPEGKKGERIDPRYADVIKKYDKKTKEPKSDGVDMNQDGIIDAGRLLAGTYQFAEKPNGHLEARAFEVGSRIKDGKATKFIRGPAQVVERDTDGDGLFTKADPSRIDTTHALTTMYIHQGGPDTGADVNTWSAGCQTIPKNRYGRFLAEIPVNSTFYYVLIDAKA